MTEGQDLRCEIGASSARVRRVDRITAKIAVMLGRMTGERYQQKPVTSIATISTKFSIGTGGIQSVSLMRFMRPTIRIHVGETVEWNSSDVSGHTITFGEEPPDVTPQTPPSAKVFADPDGARHAIINSPSDNVHSGFIAQAGHERGGVPQAPAPVAEVQPPVGVTRFRVTFTSPGTYAYICAFHDDLGMTGQVIVEP